MEALFPFTKFLPPQLDERVVADRVTERLHAAVATHPLTLVCAPAGSGKTTALAAWAQQAEQPVAWVRLAPAEDAPQVAAAALLEGIRRVISGFGDRLEAVLAGSETAASTTRLVTSLVNDLGDHPEVCLALDDFHEVTAPEGITLFDTLLDHLPAQTRVVVASRSEPALSLARRRVRGEVAELGLADLRLDAQAIAAVLARDGTVDAEQVDAVARASRGWAAAVRLATARLDRGEAADPLGAAQPELWRFLAEEVLGSQPAELRDFLLDTAILDELTPAVCAHLTGRQDAAAVLDELERRGLFIARFAGDEGPAWRYHDLFAAFLRGHLRAERSPGQVAELHRRAADALPPVQAVPHLLAAGDHDQVARAVIDVAFTSLDATIFQVVEPWVHALPAEVVERHHRLALLLALRDEFAGRPDAILARLRPLHARLRADGEDLAAAEVGLELASAHLMRGELDATAALLDDVLAQPLEGWWRMGALGNRMWWSRYSGDWTAASSSLVEAFELALAADDPAVHRVLAQALSFVLLFSDPGPSWVTGRTRRLAERLAGPGSTASLAGLRTVLAGAALLDLDLGAAADEVRRCLAASTELGRLAWIHQDAEALLLALALAAEDHATVRSLTAGAFARMEASPVDEGYRHHYAYAAARSAALRGDAAGLRAAVESLDGPAPEVDVVRTVVHAMQGGGPDVLDALAEAEQRQRELRCWLGVGMPGLERAGILLARGHASAAVEAAAPTLETAHELGAGILVPEVPAHRVLLERCAAAGVHAEAIAGVLGALDRPGGTAAVAVPGTGETLSPREVEVLAHVADGRSNRDIAEALFISEVTVKSHLTKIMRKLDATSRTHAVARARELHLL